MPSDLSHTLPRRVADNPQPSSDSNAKPPHLRALELKKVPRRAPEPARAKRQVWTFPTFSEQKAIQERAEKETISQSAIECPICQEGFYHDEVVIRVEGCGHAFHTTECFQPWFETGATTCPYCRGVLTKLTPGVWQRGEGVVPGDFYFLESPSGKYARAWNGNHPELWERNQVYHAWGNQWRASMTHRYEDVYDLVVDEPLGQSEEGFGSVEAEAGDLEEQELDLQETQPGRSFVVDEHDDLGHLLRDARIQLEKLKETLLDLSPEQQAEAEPIFRLLRLNLNSYLQLMEAHEGA
ncbi:hypothetical protein MMC26_005176 [Xylographa opegraphella]|nr:hypothetical protein [Xylographa opegraphella]